MNLQQAHTRLEEIRAEYKNIGSAVASFASQEDCDDKYQGALENSYAKADLRNEFKYLCKKFSINWKL